MFNKLFAMGTLLLLLTGCGKIMGKDNGTPGSNPNNINLERDFQRVVHYDCNHAVTADGIETVASPTAWVQIPPDHPSLVYYSDYTNRQNGAHPGMTASYSFQVDYSYGALNMHVEPGINIIDYKFTACAVFGTDPQGNRICTKVGDVVEQGTVTLNIIYTEKHLDGTLERNDCQPAPSPTPTSSLTYAPYRNPSN